MSDPARTALEVTYRPARLADVPVIHQLIQHWADQKLMLPRSTNELYEMVRDFIVAEAEPGGIVGCAALRSETEKMAELKSLAVAAAAHGLGVGRNLVLRCLEEARKLGLERVFCLTYQVQFFAKLGFTKVDRSRLPDKVWGECVRCHRFLDCDEIAMWISVAQPAAVAP